MSLLSVVTTIANEAGYAIDTSVVTSTDVTTKQLYAMANRIVQEMAEQYAWPKLFKRGTITLASGTASYALPGDFSHYHYDTFWNQSVGWRVFGPLSPQDYAMIDGYNVSPSWQHYQIRGVTNLEFTLKPTPSVAENGDIIIFEYLAKRYVRPRTWVQGQSIMTGDYTFYNGNYYTSQTTGTTGATPPTHTSSTASDGTITWAYYTGTYPTFLADTDEPVLSQRILEQGVMERFAEIKGITVNPRYAEQLNEEYSRAIPGKVLSADSEGSGHRAYAENGRVFFGS